ncbi:MAG: hypothetical protein M9939_20690 [Mesorhizobium sp.]|nr:hypothetical protein [Mesorhizobium sp.]MCO5163553.1 hypothetical protein [Mesorhizobium sp.]
MPDPLNARIFVNNLRRGLSPYLVPGVGIRTRAFLAGKEGGVVEFTTETGSPNSDEYVTVGTIAEALSQVPQRVIAGNMAGIRFGGTNTILEGNRIILIKDGDADQWSQAAAKRDIERILSSLRDSTKYEAPHS